MSPRASLLLPLVLAFLPAGALGSQEERESLQSFLARARRERDTMRAKLSAEVNAILLEIESLAGKKLMRQAAEKRLQLIELGEECASLLVAQLDPGNVGTDSQIFRARQVAIALEEIVSYAVTEELVRIAQTGSTEGRQNALQVLAKSPEPERVIPAILEIFERGSGKVRQTALVTLASLGGDEAVAVFGRALADEDPEIVALALTSLAQTGNTGAAQQVLGVLLGPRAADHVQGLLAYYEAVPEVLTENVSVAFIALLGDGELKTSSRVYVLDALRQIEFDASLEFKKEVKELTFAGSRQVSDAALTLLAALGDKNARRTLLKPYHDQIEKNKTWQDAYLQRGDILYKIRDYRSAIDNYKDAIKVGSRSATQPAPYLGLAHCYACLGRFKDAAKYLDDAPVSIVTLRKLAEHPDFREMSEHKKWRRSFHLKD